MISKQVAEAKMNDPHCTPCGLRSGKPESCVGVGCRHWVVVCLEKKVTELQEALEDVLSLVSEPQGLSVGGETRAHIRIVEDAQRILAGKQHDRTECCKTKGDEHGD